MQRGHSPPVPSQHHWGHQGSSPNSKLSSPPGLRAPFVASIYNLEKLSYICPPPLSNLFSPQQCLHTALAMAPEGPHYPHPSSSQMYITHPWGPLPQSAPSGSFSLAPPGLPGFSTGRAAGGLVLHPSLAPLTISSSPDTASSHCTPAAPSLTAVPVGGLATSPPQVVSSCPPLPPLSSPTLLALQGTTRCSALAPLRCLLVQPRPRRHKAAGRQSRAHSPLLRQPRHLASDLISSLSVPSSFGAGLWKASSTTPSYFGA